MATHDYIIANASGAAVRADLNNALAAIVSNNSNATAPTTTYAYQWWADTTANQLKLRNSANDGWIVIQELDGTMLMEDGTAAAPGLSFASDVDTGLFRPAANQLGIATSGVERVEFGTTEVVFNDSGADVNFRVEGDTNANLLFVDAGNDRVGIGTGTPSSPLHVSSSDDQLVILQSTDANAYLALQDSDSSSNSANRIGTVSDGLYFNTGGGGERMRIDSSGRVGIATTTAGSYYANELVVDTGSDAQSGITIVSGTSNQGMLAFADGTSGNERFRGFLNYNHNGDNLTLGTNGSEAVRILSNGSVGFGETNPSASIKVNNGSKTHTFAEFTGSDNTALGLFLIHTSTSYAGDAFKLHHHRSATSAMNFLAFDSAHGGTPDREFTLRGDGNAYADGTWNNNGADYAEFFESTTGSAIPVGTTVVLENNKVRAATADDSASAIMGVIRPKEPGQASMTIGNAAWNKWSGKFMTDDFDRFILDEHVVYEWTEEVENGNDINHSYESHQVPDGTTVPDDVVGQTHDAKGNRFVHYRLNPDYDPDLTYVPREERDEWVIVGLIGQVKILDGQPMNDRWIKMRDVSDAVEEWFIR